MRINGISNPEMWKIFLFVRCERNDVTIIRHDKYKKAEVNSIHMDKRIAILLVIIGILLIAIGYTIFQHDDTGDAKNTTANNTLNNTTVRMQPLKKAHKRP